MVFVVDASVVVSLWYRELEFAYLKYLIFHDAVWWNFLVRAFPEGLTLHESLEEYSYAKGLKVSNCWVLVCYFLCRACLIDFLVPLIK